MNLITYRVSSA